jgi:dihydrofolate reductase
VTKVVLDVAMSLDGFIAGPNDEIDPLHDWLFGGDAPSRHSESLRPVGNGREILDQGIDRLGATVSGRRTYELSKGWGGKPLFGRPHFIVSHRPPPEGAEAFSFVSDDTRRVDLEPTRVLESPGVTHLQFRVV